MQLEHYMVEIVTINAMVMGMLNGNQTNTTAVGRQAEMEQAMPVPAGASPTDSTGNGGGNIGTGNVPLPGEAGFASPTTQPGMGTQKQ